MFEGGGFAVGVTVVPVDDVPSPWEPVDPQEGWGDDRLGDMLPARRTSAESAGLLQQITTAESRLAALKVELIMDLAAERPASGDRQVGRPSTAGGPAGPAGVSEFLPDELALILNCSRAGATALLEQSATLIETLPATWAALADGRVDWPRARAIAAELNEPARHTDPALIAAVEAAVLPIAAESSVRRLKEAVRHELLARDAAAADRRREQARRAADVTVRPVGDGMSELGMLMPHPDALACRDTVDARARAAKQAGDPRPIGMLRAGIAADLMLRPWDDSRPPVTAHLTIVAPLDALTAGAFLGSGAPLPPAFVPPGVPAPVAEVDGEPITAAHLRELLEQLDALCPGGLQAPTDGTLEVAITDSTGRLLAVTGRPELQRLVRRGCPTHPGESCSCPVLGRPEPVDRYNPTPGQRRFLRTRDRTCRHPGCRVRAGWSDLDHVIAHAVGGATTCENLCCLCRRHHRLKTHADGWSHTLSDDGVLTVITPSGVTRISRPPGWRVLTERPEPPPSPPLPAEDPPPF